MMVGVTIVARKVHVLLEDDIDGGEATESVKFGLDGRDYEIDLNEENARALRGVLAPWIAAGRRAGAGRIPEARRAGRADDSAEIRQWARDQGIAVSARGRIAAELRARYEAAH
jgi:hypothetical protein